MRTILSTSIIPLIIFLSSITLSCDNTAKVFICTGKSATVYHRYKDCKGLNRCRSKIKAITIDEAERMGRRECKICY